MTRKKVLVLGCTGSIGKSTIDLIRKNPGLYEIAGLSAYSKEKELLDIAHEFSVGNTAIVCPPPDGSPLVRYRGTESVAQLIRDSGADIAVNGIAGAGGLLPSIQVLECGMDLALANKETIVMAGPLIRRLAGSKKCRILPVDSEHSAIFTLIERFGRDAVRSVVLTASGGPFRDTPKEKLASVTVADALRHPTWDMGRKITIDSATLANKGLEVIEACRLFDLPPDSISVTVHPQSLVHSLIRTKDGVLYAQISRPDMRHPIAAALSWPEFRENTFEQLDLSSACMTFSPPRTDDFPMLPLAYEAAGKGGLYTTAYNSANEIAVDAFIKGALPFTGIAELTAQVLLEDWSTEPDSFGDIFDADRRARDAARNILERKNIKIPHQTAF